MYGVFNNPKKEKKENEE